jgi:hypothetical protein
VFIVARYDTTRDAFADLQMAMKRAKADGRRILVDVGGTWCSWCHILDDYITEHPRVADALRRDYVTLKVNMSPRHENERFLSRYPRISGYPHLFVLDSDGKLVHSQDTSELEEGHSYNEARVLEFLARWVPARRGGFTRTRGVAREDHAANHVVRVDRFGVRAGGGRCTAERLELLEVGGGETRPVRGSLARPDRVPYQ